MNIGRLLRQKGIIGIRLELPYLEADISLENADREAAFELYVDLLCLLPANDIEAIEAPYYLEKAASFFAIGRALMHKYGRKAKHFSRITVLLLNRDIRPFTTEWHQYRHDSSSYEAMAKAYNRLLPQLQAFVSIYAELAQATDLTGLQQTDD
ncbi:MAG: hypothetical protein EAZ55_00055 [Cytophagales bacterium]|nr:MAG: hypothetical protein EAZ55_00055 [Cytophagales bacterium]